MQKSLAVGFAKYPGIQDRYDPFIILFSDQPADALAKLDQGIRKREFREWIAAELFDALGFSLRYGMGGHVKWKLGDDHLRKRAARNIDPSPKTVGSEKNAIARLTEAIGNFRSAQAVPLVKELSAGACDPFFEGVARFSKIRIAGEQS